MKLIRILLVCALSATLSGCGERSAEMTSLAPKFAGKDPESGIVYPSDGYYTKDETKPYNGRIFMNHANGKPRMVGHVANGKEEGICRTWYPNGQLKDECVYKDGRRTGLYKGWHENGKPSFESSFKDGKEDGLCKGWDDAGKLSYELKYKDGKRLK